VIINLRLLNKLKTHIVVHEHPIAIYSQVDIQNIPHKKIV